MSETIKDGAPKKAAPKKAKEPKKPLMAKGAFADKQYEYEMDILGYSDGYEIGWLDTKAFHQWNRGSDLRISCEHPETGKPTPIIIKEGGRIKTWKRVFYKMQNEYHKLTTSLDENGNEKENLEQGFAKSWEPIYEGDE